MQRAKKEEMRKWQEARAGKSGEEIAAIDRADSLEKEINEVASSIGYWFFPEEYDYIYDSVSDAKARRRGKNPMSESYLSSVDKKRQELGLNFLAESGMTTSDLLRELAIFMIQRKRSFVEGNEKPKLNPHIQKAVQNWFLL